MLGLTGGWRQSLRSEPGGPVAPLLADALALSLRRALNRLTTPLARAALAQEDVFVRTYVRTFGGPVTETATFTACDNLGPFALIVENGPGGTQKVSSGTVTLNGVEVIRPSDFARGVDRIEKPVAGLQASNQIDVRLAGTPNGRMLLTMRRAQSCGVRITSPAPETTAAIPPAAPSASNPSGPRTKAQSW